MLRFLHAFERVMVLVLLVMMMAVVLLAIINLAWSLGSDLLTPPLLRLQIDELLDVFGQFLLVLIGIELLESMRAYLADHRFHVETALAVALVALARKAVVLDLKALGPGALLGLAALVLAFTIGYFLLRSRSWAPPGTR